MEKLNIEIPKGLEVDLDKSSLKDGVIVFKEKEVTEVKSWKELEYIDGWFVDSLSDIKGGSRSVTNIHNKNCFPTKEDAESSLALAQLLQLRKRVVGDWVADWTGRKHVYVVYRFEKEVVTGKNPFNFEFLSFETSEQAVTFKKNHEQLLKTYFQIK